MRLVLVAVSALLAGCPERAAAPQDAPAGPARSGELPRLVECADDSHCALLPHVTCCGECPPAPPFDVGNRQDLDALFIEAETRCAQDRRPCRPPVCEPRPRGCYARAACVAQRCVVESEGC